MAKSLQLQIRVTAEEKAQIQQRAAEAGMDVSKWVLMQVLPPAAERFQAICTALAAGPDKRTYVLADLNDFLSSLNGNVLAATVGKPPRVQLPPFEANYVAAMVAHTAALKSIAAPRWVRDIEPLDKPWFASPLKSLRLHLLTSSPPAFRSRNLFIDSSIGDRV
jgi:Mobilization protein NikA